MSARNMNRIAMIAIIVSVLMIVSSQSTNAVTTFGSVTKPFSANSLWNSRPVNPVLNDAITVPTSKYFPSVAEGIYSTGVFVASATDSSKTVYAPVGKSGINNVDIGGTQASITIPRWPSNTLPASGSDGHCEIFDPISNVIHSFWQLKNVNGTWRASLYGWSALDGTGWGDPAHFYQGARATGVVSSAGLIRKHEVDDGDSMYRHALAMSLTYNALSANPTYVFPATSADSNAATTNNGSIPEGSLLMLPSSFNSSKLATAKLRKVAETLKTYGAYVVDRNDGTPFAIYVEIGSNYTLHPGGWSNSAASDLETIRKALRPLKSATSWLNGNGLPVTFTTNQNMLSMRGTWVVQSGSGLGAFDTYKQAVVFPVQSTRTTQANSNGNIFSNVSWAKPVGGQSYNITAVTTGGAQFRIQFNLDCANSTKVLNSGVLNNGQSFVFIWPIAYCRHFIYAISGLNQISTVAAALLKA